MTTKIQSQVNKIKKDAEKYAKELLSDMYNPDEVEYKVRDILDTEVNKVVLQSLGFEHRYGDQWEVDHCNSRDKHTAIGQFLREKADETIREWLLEQMDTLPKLNRQQTKALKEYYRETLYYKTRDRLYTLAQDHADEYAEKIFAELKPKLDEAV